MNKLIEIVAITVTIATTFGASAFGAVSAPTSAVRSTTAATNWTPLLIQPLTPHPQSFKGGEGQWHLVYDVLLTNFNSHPSTITKLEILEKNAAGKWNPVKTLEGTSLNAVLSKINKAGAANVLQPGSVALAFINLDFADANQVPNEIAHRVTFNSNDALGNPKTFDYGGGTVAVDKTTPVVVSPPLRGGRWVVGGGYGGKTGHRTARFPVNNQLQAAQTFAIDWVKVDDKGYSTHNPSSVTGSPTYNDPIYAVADGTILGVVDRFTTDQIPNKPTGNDRIAWPGGNSVVQDIGHGHYAFYAHMKPGSIKVKPGDHVTRGQEIGHVGSTGNSSAPHLHMHITRDPGILNAHGVPYYFDNFDVIGQITDFDSFDRNDTAGKPQLIDKSPVAGSHKNELPTEGQLLEFK